MTEPTDTITLSGAIRRGAIGLGLFAVLTAGLIALTQQLTAERIADNKRAFEAQTLLALVPADQHDNELLDTAYPTDLAGLTQTELLRLPEPALWYQAQQNDEVVAVILPLVAPEGYTEAIRLIMAVDHDGTLMGVRVVQHRETPGLGDQVEVTKSDWIHGFDGQSLGQPPLEDWQVKKDGGAFDQLTGATITPRAVVRAVARGLQFFELNRSVLLTINPTQEPSE
ncbi:electron transport complex subunit RsxG [Saccharospirillum sp. HFRX-1]|uniref:electron transport complex subunit RsxG n=1 Tax=unclassified Saccharospirillum TaxID=2633430 RepID=UPI003724A44B